MTRRQDVADFEELRSGGEAVHEVDALPGIVEELFRIEFPFLAPDSPFYGITFRRYLAARWNGGDVRGAGVWAYFPWRRTAVHLPDEATFLRLRTARNRDLITPREQELYQAARVGVAGLSVGMSAVTTLVGTGGAGRLRIADPDVLGATNLNRVTASVCHLGAAKTAICAERLWELNPFQRIEVFDGLTERSAEAFFGRGADCLDLLVEETDDLRTKAFARFAARARRIPVLMATDNGDNVLVDVERFDLEPERPLFHGAVDEARLCRLGDRLADAERVTLADALVGPEMTVRVKLSLLQVGTRLVGWPQLGTAAALAGAALAYAARRILTGRPMPSGRYAVALDEALDVGHRSPAAVAERERVGAEYRQSLRAMFGDAP
ncbi:ThiF family adenylyltransferase [Streptomyces sp. NRRL F-5123]|uniref:ThiF family adenylyltransferase n=1 Tax=Streptomyces sp. NRRL F-5123 TaxID=1463856 RepID=UPI00131D8A26|nr:ThiF family adenylyltransferase [Streptomyces sp. NRRL F-5123]